jgi:subtilisin family serine protease
VSPTGRIGQRRPVIVAGVVAAVTAFAALTTPAVHAQPVGVQVGSQEATYIVQMAGDPVATYRGGHPGIAATRPAAGAKVDSRAPNVRALRSRLRAQHDGALRGAKVDTARRVYDYSTTFNGFAARLTPAQAGALKGVPGVRGVWRNARHTVDTFSTPRFLGLSGKGGTWTRQFGNPSRAGEGVIVGVIDSGFWPENPSFAALPSPRPDQAIIDAKWRGTCDAGVESPIVCNNKVIGARYYNSGGRGIPEEFESPRDFNGHGSHTAGTAAGNLNVPAAINGVPAGNVSGMAPAARIAVYKVLWHNASGNTTGGTDDILAAIDDAVNDGVDVINYSISGNQPLVVDPLEMALLSAAAAGVFVSTSAGNNGENFGVSSVYHNSPWVTTVAASTHDRGAEKTLTLGDGRTFVGSGAGPGVAAKTLVDAADAALPVPPGQHPAQWAEEAELCVLDRLDPAKVTGKVVLCLNGVNTRVSGAIHVRQSLAVKQAGGAGMILYNPAAASVDADFHHVPSIHVDHTVGPRLKAYAGSSGPTAALSNSRPVTVRAPQMAAFSSFGPAIAGGGDLIKPDITAPGVDVVAAAAPPANNNNMFENFHGTSMSAPHIAGIAALLKSKNPTWSPMWIKSAMMTTATPTDSAGQTIKRLGVDATPLHFGNGHVRPGNAFDPGLVYDSNETDWFRYTCGIGQAQTLSGGEQLCAEVGSIDPSDLNYPSIGIGDLPGEQIVTRTVTNITGQASVYQSKVTAPPGFTVTVSPSRLEIAPGRSATFRVTLTRKAPAPFGQWAFGSLSWRDNADRDVRSAIGVRPVALALPAETQQSGASGSTSLQIRTGFGGTLTATGFGLDASTVTPMHLVGTEQAFDDTNPQAGPAVGKVTVTVPTGTKVARTATRDADYADQVDLDVYAYEAGTSNLVGVSAGATAEEMVALPQAGSYDIYVVQFGLPDGTTELDVKHHRWAVGSSAGNLTVTPASQPATVGGDTPVTVAWTGLTPGTPYLGVVEFGNGSITVGSTIVAVVG